jgi:hypothetical protein
MNRRLREARAYDPLYASESLLPIIHAARGIRSAYDETKHPRGRGGKWTKGMHVQDKHGRVGVVKKVGNLVHEVDFGRGVEKHPESSLRPHTGPSKLRPSVPGHEDFRAKAEREAAGKPQAPYRMTAPGTDAARAAAAASKKEWDKLTPAQKEAHHEAAARRAGR